MWPLTQKSPCFFLRQLVKTCREPRRAQESRRLGAAGMIALSAAAIEREALAACRSPDSRRRRRFQKSRCPSRSVEAAVGASAAAARAGDVPVMGVVGNARGLVDRETLIWFSRVAAHFREGLDRP